jgi:U2 small nuclear ribonucleoprotein B''
MHLHAPVLKEDQRIEYAKTKSYAALKREDPEYVPPSVLKLQSNPPPASMLKRRRDEDTFFNDAKDAKKRNVNGKDGDEMEMDDEEEQASSSKATGSGSAVQTNGPSSSPTAALVCTNLPLEVSDDVLAVLFQQYRGFQSTQVYNAVAGTPGKWAHVYFESPELATVARNALDGFTLKKGWVMAVRFS